MTMKDKSIGAAFCDAAAVIGGNARLGIVCAMDVEMQDLLEQLRGVSVEETYGFKFYEGMLEQTQVVLVRCGIGKVNAARGTQLMIDKYKPSYIINSGVAGALNKELRPMDIVVGKDFIQHDFDLSPIGYAKGCLATGDRSKPTIIEADDSMVKLLADVSEVVAGEYKDAGKVLVGRIVSGDQFINSPEVKAELRDDFGGDAAEMEGAVLAYVASCANIPCAVLRVISDMADGTNNESYDEFEKKASKLSAEIIIELAKLAPSNR